ncbi:MULTISPECIES: DnaT-like ssDNA-binding domain-containing protein [unclassified Pantoea]|uniref:DnaT-like ssDNA-binding domain-containing protein n=1 Tax=unclassified Pantoea TaxID=2630326 RepID=UPI0020645F30|nr:MULTISPECIES: DnaT-like ssDNA-binding domain-containing protein [unclassified Pantoea]MDU5473991.1 DnaT-like ssDNA-binding domain-containing protein [Pantoea sp.]DAI70364.1 MAG TPA: Primosomal protein 1 [Bacteriophage sp.]
MSLDAMRWAKKVKTGRSSAKAVLTWLADMCGSDLTAYPSITALAEATELDKKTVQSCLQYLIAQGFIEDTGERRGRTKQIPVYRLTGVEESIADAERTQKRDCLNDPKIGSVKPNNPKSGCVKNNQTIPFFPSNDPKNGIRNPPEEPKDLNPIYSQAKISPGEILPEIAVLEYPGRPGVLFSASPPAGKFAMHPNWDVSPDFEQRAALWGRAVPARMNRQSWQPVLHSFIAYWQAEGKFFHQVQWEQKFATQLQRAAAENLKTRGIRHAEPDSTSTANVAVQQIRAARAQQQRVRGQGMGILGDHGGNLLQPVDDKKRVSPVRSLDCSGREFDQYPDDNNL